MSDTYQAVYDAVRSRMTNGDIGNAIEQSIRDMNLPHYVERAMHSVAESIGEYAEPSSIFRPVLSIDGNQWCALYGDNLQDGVAGFGDSPALAMRNFNKNWHAKLPAESEDR